MTQTPAPFVTNHAWLRAVSRADAIDDVADTYERRPEPSAPTEMPSTETSTDGTTPPRRSARRRSAPRLHPTAVREPV